jgi:L,D-transpeptidase catalytic domain/Putative peptidoglycan binding domain/Sporulation and spore germination
MLGALVLALLLAVPASAQAEAVKVYFLKGEQFRTVDRDVRSGPDALGATVRSLLRGPRQAERAQGYGTAIPKRCRLVSAAIDTPRRRAILAFNRRCAQTREVSRSPEDDVRIFGARVAQLVYTVTTLTGVRDVEIAVPGRDTVIVARDDLDQRRFRFPKAPAPVGPRPDDARGVQQALTRLKYLPPSAVNGRWDYRTQQAVMAFQSWEGLARDGIVGKQTVGRLATAGVPRPADAGGSGRRVEIHRARGVLLLIQNGRVRRAIHTSTGKGGDSTTLGTPPGRFKIYRKEERSWSYPYQVWLPWAAYWNAGWAMHGYADVPAYPASHGCARLPMPEAENVYRFVSVGTPVRVI